MNRAKLLNRGAGIVGVIFLLLCFGIEAGRTRRMRAISQRNDAMERVEQLARILEDRGQQGLELPPSNVDSAGHLHGDALDTWNEMLTEKQKVAHLAEDPAYWRATAIRWYRVGDGGVLLAVGPDGKLDLNPGDIRMIRGSIDEKVLSVHRYDPTNGHASGGDIWIHVVPNPKEGVSP
ncbi:hypothetical protein GC173_04320 [bacterium]|nr:hypothetical protein [bacterium]